MRDRSNLHDLFTADPRDGGCRETFEQLDQYVEAELSEQDAARRFPRAATHLRGCTACHQDFVGLVAAVAGSGADGSR
jgi:hypothetical protein